MRVAPDFLPARYRIATMQTTRNTALLLVLIIVLVIVAAYLCKCDADACLKKRYTGGNPYTHTLEPAGHGPHTHHAALGQQGLGTSTTDMGHAHRVQDFQDVGVETDQGVAPSPDGHVHDITAFIQTSQA